MRKILVVGGLYAEEKNEQLRIARKEFAAAIGRQIILKGYTLLGGCRTSLDDEVAYAAEKAALTIPVDPKTVIKSWITDDAEPSHQHGELIRSNLKNWSHVPKGFTYPEQITHADAVIIIGGWDGTHYAASWVRMAKKPLFPVASFGLAAQEIYGDELKVSKSVLMNETLINLYSILNRCHVDTSIETLESYSKEIITCIDDFLFSKRVFIIMSFSEKGHLIDAYDTFKRCCKKYNLNAFRVDQNSDTQERIIPRMLNAIQQSEIIIADVTEARPNVYYELGYAHASGKKVIVTAHKDTKLPFDIFDVPVQFWESQNDLSLKLNTLLKKYKAH